ncbi:hypothetical protein [Bacillus massiliglaciei]|uniref:hypothetical protein n=1 Tax=Bacillus massiliglaciei TaxID=1816693 RepID=UPI0018FE8DE9|nr:hypothetical protein [Bacillus massiliglaciei]
MGRLVSFANAKKQKIIHRLITGRIYPASEHPFLKELPVKNLEEILRLHKEKSSAEKL